MRILLIVILAAIIILGLGSLALVFSNSEEPAPSSTPLVFQEQKAGENFSAIVEQKDQENHRRFLVCNEKRCDIAPNLINQYFYHDEALVKKTGREDQTIAVKTKLVVPRGLFTSPDGKKIAYFLDNIHDNKKELTELWLYDGQAGTRLLVENIVQPDVLTEPRWNRSGTHLWYIANNGQKEEKIELVVVQVSPVAVSARFTAINWRDLKDIAENGTMDISFTGRSLALAQPNSFGRSAITILHEGTPPRAATVPGEVTFMQWSENGDLLYATRQERSFAFWRARSTVHEQVNYKLAPIPTFGESGKTKIVSLQTHPDSQAVAGISSELDDAELAAFIEKHLPEIAGQPAEPMRVITTTQPNVIYVDYRKGGQEGRMLLTIHDAVHPEWSIQARYEPVGGEWHKTQGTGFSDPEPKNVYEWEKDVNQWILKSQPN